MNRPNGVRGDPRRAPNTMGRQDFRPDRARARPQSQERGASSLTPEQLQALSELTLRVQKKMKQELGMREIWIPNADAKAKCSIFASPDYSVCSKLLVFVQTSRGIQPGLWGRPLALRYGQAGSMLPYLELALQNNYGIIILNPGTNLVNDNGVPVPIPSSSTPWEHASYVFSQYIRPAKADKISFIAFYNGGVLVKDLLENFDVSLRKRISAVVFLESTHQVKPSDSEWLRSFLSDSAVNFKSTNLRMFCPVPREEEVKGCLTLSSGYTNDKSENFAWTVAAMQNSTFVFLEACRQGMKEAQRALQATCPNKLIVTIGRTKLNVPAVNSPFVAIFCGGQKRETAPWQQKSMNPDWNQTFTFPVSNGEAAVVIQVKDRGFTGSKVLGQNVIQMLRITQSKPEKKWYPLKQDNGGRMQKSNTEVELTVEWLHDTFVSQKEQAAVRQNYGPIEPQNVGMLNGTLSPNPAEDSMCYLCNDSFRGQRKHQCRLCLRNVCTSCSDRLFLPGFEEPQRICKACYEMQVTMQGNDKAVVDHVEDMIRQSEARLPPEKRRQPQKPLTPDDFDLMKVVGRGAFGKVLLVRKKAGKNAGSVYAMKILKKSHIIKNDQVENTKAEQHILKEIDHPFIVRLRYAFQSPDKLYLVMDYYPGGSLFYHLRKSKRFSEARTRLYGAELLTALIHLHGKNIAYRDLKLENILMDKDGHISLTDFGLSKENNLGQGESEGMRTICGTAEYMAPELLRHQPYGKVVDWWSYGILVFEMLTGRTPFVDRNRRQMFKNIVSSEAAYPSYISPVCRDLISKLLIRDPAKRLGGGPEGGAEIMQHPFYDSINWDKLLKREVQPPFVPQVTSEEDTNYTPQLFQSMEPVDSPTGKQSMLGIRPSDGHFENFSYVESSLPREVDHLVEL